MNKILETEYIDLVNQLKKVFINNNVDINKKMLLGISGGPDSMWLLYLLKDFDIIVSCVNYGKRYDSHYDEKLVRLFCLENNIPCEILNLSHSDDNAKGNFQTIARDERYEFYKELYKKHDCNYLILAHHKDDFIETAIMQKNSKREPLFYGIKTTNVINKMLIFRPMIELFYKDEIKDLCNKFSILFASDYTNDLPIYTRNQIRLTLKAEDKKHKDNIIKQFNLINNKNKQQEIEIKDLYEMWKNQEFDCDKLDYESPKLLNLIYYSINQNYQGIELSKNKIINIIDFLKSNNRTSKFKLNNNNYLIKIKNKVIF